MATNGHFIRTNNEFEGSITTLATPDTACRPN